MHPDTPPQALYVHVPFCVRKCGYCDFYSLEAAAEADVAAYLDALEAEARRSARLAPKTVYLGGGTPTALPAAALKRLMRLLAACFDLSGVAEFTVEANPGTLDETRLEALVAGGVNRVSLGVQSMNPAILAVLGRIHGPEQVRQAVGLLRPAGIDNLSLDLMFAVPGQTLHQWQRDLRTVLELRPEHLSVYGLSIPARTPMGQLVARGRLAPVADELYVEMLESAREVLTAAGFEHYEISNYALSGRRCRHNLVYWRNQPYVGLGPAATSYVGGRRATSVADLAVYVDRLRHGGDPTEHSECLTAEARARETAILNLRTCEGIRKAAFGEQTGFDPLKLFAEVIATHVALGHLEVDAEGIRLARPALAVADGVLADFVA